MRPYKKWEEKETLYLIVGYKMFGSQWKKIKDYFPTILNNRTRINLKDRFRLLDEINDKALFDQADQVYKVLNVIIF